MHPTAALAALLVVALVSFYPSEVAYPPVKSTPSSIAVIRDGRALLTLPAERSVAVFDIGSGSLWKVELGFAPDGLAVSGSRALAYSRLGGVYVVVDVERLTPLREFRTRIEGVWPVPGGFLVHKGAGLSLLDLDGEELRYLRVGASSIPWHVSSSGRTVWFVGEDLRSIHALDLERWEVRRVATHQGMISSIAALSEEAVAVASEAWIGVYRIDGSSRALELPYRVSSRVLVLPAKASRVVFVDQAEGRIGMVGGGVKWHSLTGVKPDLVASPSPSRVYVFDVSQMKADYYDMTFRPEVSGVKLEAKSGPSVHVEATVRDLDGDLLEGGVSVRLNTPGGPIVAAMRPIGGERFATTVDLRGYTGELEVVVVAVDGEGNEAESQPQRIEVKGESAVVVTTPTQVAGTGQTSPQAGAPLPLSDLLAFSVELAFFAVLLAALALVAVRGRRRERRRSRRR